MHTKEEIKKGLETHIRNGILTREMFHPKKRRVELMLYAEFNPKDYKHHAAGLFDMLANVVARLIEPFGITHDDIELDFKLGALDTRTWSGDRLHFIKGYAWLDNPWFDGVDEIPVIPHRFENHHRHPRKTHLAFTQIVINHLKIGGIIMDFTLNKDTPSVQLLVQDLDVNGAILPEIDTVTGHPTLQPGSLVVTGDGNIVVTQDPTNPALVTVSRANNTTSATSTLTAKAVNDNGEAITGSSVITVVADPVVDNGIAESLQFVPAPVTPAAPAVQA